MTEKKPSKPITESQQPRPAKVDKLEVSIHSQQPTKAQASNPKPPAGSKTK